jgi:transketolase
MKITEVKSFATTLRKNIIQAIYDSGSGHPGGSLSAADAVAVLYKNHLAFKADDPKWENRDRFILSKGHCAPLLYAVLAEVGYFPKKELSFLRKYGHMLQGHPDSLKTPGVEVSTGSLGQGLSIAGGMALGLRNKKLNSRVYCLMGDGELAEGQIWEAAMAIAHFKLDNVCGIIDYNGLQIDGTVTDVMNIEPLDQKFRAFGWNVVQVDGHDYTALDEAYEQAKLTTGIPTVIIMRTIKGKGVSYMENMISYHHAKDLSSELYEQAMSELDNK